MSLHSELSSVLWRLLRFPHKNDVRFILTSSCLYEWGLVSYYVICVYLHIVVSNIYCVVFLFFFVLCTLCCQFLWVVSPFGILLILFTSIIHFVFLKHATARKQLLPVPGLGGIYATVNNVLSYIHVHVLAVTFIERKPMFMKNNLLQVIYKKLYHINVVSTTPHCWYWESESYPHH